MLVFELVYNVKICSLVPIIDAIHKPTMIKIRLERKSDQKSIREITELAFKGKPYADGDEQDLIEKLRKAGALALSLVALDNEELVGQVTFSLAKIDSATGPWYALGPVSVTPSRQREGIGSRLIEAGLSEIKHRGALGCILVGDPVFYSRFGFEVTPFCCPESEPEKYFMVKLFSTVRPTGCFSFHSIFYEDG